MNKIFTRGGLYNLRRMAVAIVHIVAIFLLMGVVTPAQLQAASISETQQAKIAADIAAKKPMRLILREARSAGISTQDSVTAMLDAGANHAAVVNAAVAEGHETNDAVKVTLTFGKEKCADNILQSVTAAAIAAGVTQENFTIIASEAGCQPAKIANALVAALTASGAPVYGYSSPTSQTGDFSSASSGQAVITTAPPAIGGGGGGGGTKNVSPTKPKGTA